MKSLRAAFFALLFVLSPAAAASGLPDSSGIVEGEHLRYKVVWMGIPIGTGDVRIETAKDHPGAWLVTAEARSNEFLSTFCRVSDVMTSLVSQEDFTAIRAEKSIQEGRYKAHERLDFDTSKNVAYYESFTNGSKKEIPLEGKTLDILGAFYWFRLQKLVPGEGVITRVTADEKNWEMKVKVLRTERLEIRKRGVFDTFVAEPVAKFKGVFVKRGRAWVHFTADSRRIPLRIRMNTPFGPVIGVLEEPPEGVIQ